MASVDYLYKFILSWEGGYANVPGDKGGATNKGITIATWRTYGYDKDGDGDIDVNDLKIITDEDFKMILKKNFWNTWKADQIQSQAIANLLVDWIWASGKYGIKIPQQLLGVTADGIVGPKTIAALNAKDPKSFFTTLWNRRQKFIYNIVKSNPSQKKFLKGWLNRLNGIQYTKLICNNNKGTITW